MAYTRPWTKAEERQVKACPRALLTHIARRLHRTPSAVLDRWYRCHGKAVRTRKPRDGWYGLLPVGVPVHDPRGTICGTCGQERLFLTDDGRCFQECRCGREFIARRRP